MSGRILNNHSAFVKNELYGRLSLPRKKSGHSSEVFEIEQFVQLIS